MGRPDWNLLKLYYLQNSVSLQEAAKKFGVCRSVVWRRSAKEHWPEQKKAYERKVAEMVRERNAEKRAEAFLELQEALESGISESGQFLLAKLRETLCYGEAFSPRDLKNLSGTLLDLHQEYRNAKADAGDGGEDVQVIEWVNNEWDMT